MKTINRLAAIMVFSITICSFYSFNVYSQENESSKATTEAKKINPTLEKGIGLYKHENYDEAIGVLKKARLEEPQSTLAAYYLGLTYKQTQDYNAAVPHLRDAITMSPKIIGALI